MALSAALLSFAASAARTEICFNDGWEFSRDRKTWHPVTVPHDWAIEEGFDPRLPHGSGALPWNGVGYYRKSLVLDRKIEGRLFLRFDGIMCDGTVFIDSQCAGHQPYGYLGLEADVTPYVHAGTNSVLVKADTTKLQSRWYPGAGMYRNTHLIATDAAYLPEDELFIQTPEVSAERATVRVSGVLRNRGECAARGEVEFVLRDAEGATVAKSSVPVAAEGYSDGAFSAAFAVVKPRLWTMRPNAALYALTVTYRGGTANDELVKRVGIRSCRFDAERGFFLNGEHVQLRGVDLHADLGILGMAFNRSAMRRQLEIMREMGANALRTSHNPPAPEVLDLCDEMGFFVWDECFDKWTATAGKGDEPLEPYIESGLVQLVRRDRNHPSVIVWSMGNEIPSAGAIAPGETFWGSQSSECTTRERCSRFRLAMRKCDPTRAIGIACCWTNAVPYDDYADLDLTGWNYAERYQPLHARHPEQPIVYSESASAFSVYGYYYPERQATNRADYVGAPRMIDSYDRNSAVYSDIPDVEFERMERDRFVAGEFVWTGIDYLGEPAPYENDARSSYFGICDLLGFPKDRYYLYRSYWRHDVPTLHIVPHHWNFAAVKTLPVYVYSDADEVGLFLNGKPLGRRRKDPNASCRNGYYDVMNRYRFVWNDIAYEPGELKAVAYDISGREVGVQSVRTAGPAARVVVGSEQAELPRSGDELVFCRVTLADADGVPVPDDCRRVGFAAEGDCAIVAVGNGDPTGMDCFKRIDSHPLHMGRCGFAVRRTGPGAARVRVTAEGLVAGVCEFGAVR